MRRPGWWLLLGVVAALVVRPPAAAAFDPKYTFREGTVIFSGEAAYGEQFNLEGFDNWSKLKFWNTGVRASILPFGPAGPGPLYGAFEVGLEPLFQQYTDPVNAYFAGLAAVFRYHFLSLGPVVPYAELAASAGGTNLKVREIRSDFTFLLFGGLGASVFITDETALYAGYRYEHVSNGHVSDPNRGFESHVGVAGVSFYLPDW